MERPEEVRKVLNSVQERVVGFVEQADRASLVPGQKDNESQPKILDFKKPEELKEVFKEGLTTSGQGHDGLVRIVDDLLKYSVNTWQQGFLDKLYSSPNAPGLAAELLLGALNANVHVYQSAPALTVVEKLTTRRFAELFGLTGPNAGGISVQGGSASNTTAIVVARNTLFPDTKKNGTGDHRFVLFTSAHGHYSIEKAAQMIGLGSNAVCSVPVDREGRMIPQMLDEEIQKAKDADKTPLFVNATAGTTVLGTFDPFSEIAEICRKHKLWFHIDGAWGGAFIFSNRQKHKLEGSHLADSIAINPHKMLGVPLTCSFLLGADMTQFHGSNTLPAGYLFHNDVSDGSEVWDLGDLTLQCGRRGDALKMFLNWNYIGSAGYEERIDSASDVAVHLCDLISESPDLILLSENPPPCFQICFFYAPFKQMVHGSGKLVDGRTLDEAERGKLNGEITSMIADDLIQQGFMVDYAPPAAAQVEGDGKYLRCVVNLHTKKETVERLVEVVLELGAKAVRKQRGLELNSTFVNPNRALAPGQRPKNPLEMGHGPQGAPVASDFVL
ncbi:Glutamate decarboxylase 2 [Microsporum ferrugineum]